MAPDRNTRMYYKLDKVRPGPDRNRRTSQTTTRQQDLGFTQHDPTPQQLRDARLAYGEAREHGDLITWSSVTNSPMPVIYNRPCRENHKGTWTLIAASAFNNLPSFKGPQCPHAMNPFRLEEDTEMTCRHNKNRGWYFQAKGHNCEFILNIPPLGSSKIRLHGDKSKFEDGEWADSDDEEESFALMALDEEAAQRVREVNVATAALMEGIPLSWPPPYSPGSSSSLPSYPLSSPVASSSRPSPTKSDGCVKPYFTRTQAEERANFNRQFTTGLHDKQFSGKFKVYPERHPAWKSGLEDAPVIMASFHPETPGSRLPPMGFMTTLCGQMLSQLRGTMSIVVGGSALILLTFAELYPELEGLYDMATRMYPEGTPLPNHSDHINSMVGRAWIAWNSRVGVPQDVWAILSSAWTHCPDCDLVRTFEADRAHKDDNNMCRDIGQDQ
ncbi:hypothetical protein B0H10DRAFT_1969508 [Mycena sp. CBHHK59/15]|nr:hypothetical protein B0H10DRAFT_1969508 [Mycena sp. CBHHK59/15]